MLFVHSCGDCETMWQTTSDSTVAFRHIDCAPQQKHAKRTYPAARARRSKPEGTEAAPDKRTNKRTSKIRKQASEEVSEQRRVPCRPSGSSPTRGTRRLWRATASCQRRPCPCSPAPRGSNACVRVHPRARACACVRRAHGGVHGVRAAGWVGRACATPSATIVMPNFEMLYAVRPAQFALSTREYPRVL
jgi:hypothetical protein